MAGFEPHAGASVGSPCRSSGRAEAQGDRRAPRCLRTEHRGYAGRAGPQRGWCGAIRTPATRARRSCGRRPMASVSAVRSAGILPGRAGAGSAAFLPRGSSCWLPRSLSFCSCRSPAPFRSSACASRAVTFGRRPIRVRQSPITAPLWTPPSATGISGSIAAITKRPIPPSRLPPARLSPRDRRPSRLRPQSEKETSP